jgi:ribonuclease Z
VNFSLYILGSNSALPTKSSFSTAQVLSVHERFFLLDCAEGTQIQLRKFKINFNRINNIFISHLHGDHLFGLFGLLSSFNLMGRKNPLTIHAHKNIRKILNNHFKYFDHNRQFEIVYNFIDEDKPKLCFEDDKLSVISFPLKHRIASSGFLFQEKKQPDHIIKEKIVQYNIPLSQISKIKNGADFITPDGKIIKHNELTIPSYKPRSYAFCSDTIYFEPIINIIKNIDLLYHEATFLSNEKIRASETFHSTPADAAKIASMANVRKLLLGHFSIRYKDLSLFLNEAIQYFDNTELVSDGDVFEIKKSGEIIKTNKFT